MDRSKGKYEDCLQNRSYTYVYFRSKRGCFTKVYNGRVETTILKRESKRVPAFETTVQNKKRKRV